MFSSPKLGKRSTPGVLIPGLGIPDSAPPARRPVWKPRWPPRPGPDNRKPPSNPPPPAPNPKPPNPHKCWGLFGGKTDGLCLELWSLHESMGWFQTHSNSIASSQSSNFVFLETPKQGSKVSDSSYYEYEFRFSARDPKNLRNLRVCWAFMAIGGWLCGLDAVGIPQATNPNHTYRYLQAGRNHQVKSNHQASLVPCFFLHTPNRRSVFVSVCVCVCAICFAFCVGLSWLTLFEEKQHHSNAFGGFWVCASGRAKKGEVGRQVQAKWVVPCSRARNAFGQMDGPGTSRISEIRGSPRNKCISRRRVPEGPKCHGPFDEIRFRRLALSRLPK